MQSELDSLQEIISQRDTELDDILSVVNDIQDGIKRINEAEGRVTIADGNVESASNKEIIRDNMQFIQESMEQNRTLIAQLKEKLNASSFQAKQLKQTIDNLQEQISAQSARIQELQASLAEKDAQLVAQNEQITSLNENVSGLTAENKAKTQKVASQEAELNTGWFVFGTKRELKEQKILDNGDVLKSDDFNHDYFTQIDIRKSKDIKLYSKNATLLTSHPANTYKLEKDAEGLYELHITNPEKFWSVSKYLVIQVK